MINIYQLFPRLFGNKNTHMTFDGDRSINGCGTFSDIDNQALEAIKNLGITHIWLTGVIRHASGSAYEDLGIYSSHPQITKGKAGSPYAIIDYYDVDPDLAIIPAKRMQEFETLIERIHKHGMYVIIDLVPNHVARQYHSIAAPNDIVDFGDSDDDNNAFVPNNNYYYCPNESFVAPERQTNTNEPYYEYPAKASGNDIFSSHPSYNDWYDTIKLNYGRDYFNNRTSFDPIPNTWFKIYDIVKYWQNKNVDGFRVDMAEMVPIEFWRWLIKNINDTKKMTWIAEIYNPDNYRDYSEAGFDFLYDKVGMYNKLEAIFRYGHPAHSIGDCWRSLNGLDDKMLRFMENHDEVRLASPHFYGDPLAALPAVTVAALMNRGPFMIYNGQESSEDALGNAGYGGDDGRTTLFDYHNMPMHQRWMNNGKFDGALFSDKQNYVFGFYRQLLRLRNDSKAISEGCFYDLMWVNPQSEVFDANHIYAFLRYHQEERLLVVTNFSHTDRKYIMLKIPQHAIQLMSIDSNKTRCIAHDLMGSADISFDIDNISDIGVSINLSPLQVAIYKLEIIHL